MTAAFAPAHAQDVSQPATAPPPSAAASPPAAEPPAVTQPAAAASQPPVAIAALPAPVVTKQHRRQAENAYLAGAKKLEHDDALAAERDFTRAAQLDPASPAYPGAVSVARQRRLAELVRQASAARTSGDEAKAQTLLAEARTLDPESPLVLEHAQPTMSASSSPSSPTSPQLSPASLVPTATPSPTSPASDAPTPAAPWRIETNLAGPVRLAPTPAPQTFDLSGNAPDIIRQVLQAYGIHAIVDDSVDHKVLRFRLDHVSYAEAVNALAAMANVFLVPIGPTTVIAAKDDDDVRKRLEPQLEETLYLPGISQAQFSEIAQSLRGIFPLPILILPQASQDTIVVRAPEDVMAALNQTVQGLQETSGEVVIEVRLYEVDTSKMVNAGANVPTQFGLFNVDQAAAQLVSQNSALVQQAIAQGLISSTASNFQIAAALIGSGLVKSSLLNSTIGVFGGGLMQTGITETGSLGVNLGLNSSDTRTLDDIQLRVRDRETANFREGTRYPVTTSTYSVGLSGAASALGSAGNATINGVSLSSLLSQATAASTTIPQITYEDLGITLEATPVIQKSGRIDMKLELKIEALTGNSVNSIPVLASRDFKSTLTVGEGQSAMLSSLVSSSEISAMSGLPGISELPGFQAPINENVQKQTTQLVVVVTPHVARRRPSGVAGPMIPLPVSMNGQ